MWLHAQGVSLPQGTGRVSLQTVPGSDKTHLQVTVDLPEVGEEPETVSTGRVASTPWTWGRGAWRQLHVEPEACPSQGGQLTHHLLMLREQYQGGCQKSRLRCTYEVP